MTQAAFTRKRYHRGNVKIDLTAVSRIELKKVYLEKPAGLTAVEEQIWDFLAKHLGDNYIVDECDAFALRLFCKTINEYYEIRKKLEKEGLYYVTEKGERKINPLYKVSCDLFNRIMQFIKQFGLCPQSRNKFTIARNSKLREEKLNELNAVEQDDMMDLLDSHEESTVQS